MLTTRQASPFDLFFTSPFFDAARAERPSARFVPLVDLYEQDDALVLVAEVPGLKAADLEIEVDKNVLKLRGSRERDIDGDAPARFRTERQFGSFERRFALPDYVDPGAIEADLADGVLTLRMQKRPEQKPRRIQVGTPAPEPPALEAA